MEVILVDLNEELCAAWREEFANCPAVTVVNGSFDNLTADALVSPANSLGCMRGGIDGAYSRVFGYELERAVMGRIKAEHNGSLPVGQAISVRIPHAPGKPFAFKHLVSAPTMHAPGQRLVGTPNVYAAAKAAFSECLFMGYASVVMPGLGTGVGGVPPTVCAAHMKAAYAASSPRQPFPISDDEAALFVVEAP